MPPLGPHNSDERSIREHSFVFHSARDGCRPRPRNEPLGRIHNAPKFEETRPRSRLPTRAELASKVKFNRRCIVENEIVIAISLCCDIEVGSVVYMGDIVHNRGVILLLMLLLLN